MSHFTTVKTQISDLVRLKTIINELGFTIEEATETLKVFINGWNKSKEEALIKIKTGCSYDIGVIKNEEGMFEFVADWWGVESTAGIVQEEFINKITQKYAYSTVMDKIREKGYDIVEEVVDDKQSIRIVVRRWE
jgi:hypothetical protein